MRRATEDGEVLGTLMLCNEDNDYPLAPPELPDRLRVFPLPARNIYHLLFTAILDEAGSDGGAPMHTPKDMYRQGDVLLRKIGRLPAGLVAKDRTLARGEATGHSHTLNAGEVFVDGGGQQFVQLAAPTVLAHQEHAPLTLPKGVYEVVLQREFDAVEGVRRVLD